MWASLCLKLRSILVQEAKMKSSFLSHKASAMLWRKGSKPSFAHPSNKVWVPVNVLPNVAVSLLPPTLPVSEETSSPSDDVQPNHSGVPHLSPHRIFG
jgi:hypothetical protein